MKNNDIDDRIYDLYDEYCHGKIDRRQFFERAGANLARRESLLAFVSIFGGGGLLGGSATLLKAWKVNGFGNGLPEGWEQPMGPRDRL